MEALAPALKHLSQLRSLHLDSKSRIQIYNLFFGDMTCSICRYNRPIYSLETHTYMAAHIIPCRKQTGPRRRNSPCVMLGMYEKVTRSTPRQYVIRLTLKIAKTVPTASILVLIPCLETCTHASQTPTYAMRPCTLINGPNDTFRPGNKIGNEVIHQLKPILEKLKSLRLLHLARETQILFCQVNPSFLKGSTLNYAHKNNIQITTWVWI